MLCCMLLLSSTGPDIVRKLGAGEPGSLGFGGFLETPDVDPSASPSPHQRTRSIQGRPPGLHGLNSHAGPPGHGPPGSKAASPSPVPALLSSPLECAVAGSSSHIGDRLHGGNNKYADHNHRRMPSREPSIDNYYTNPSSASNPASTQHNHHDSSVGGGGASGGGGYYSNHNSVPHHNRLPHSQTNNTRRLPRQERLPSDSLNPSLTPSYNEPSYQYSSHQRDDSGLGRELDSPVDYRGQNHHQQQHHHHHHQPMSSSSTMDRSPDSGVSDSDDLRSRPLQRRKTLPSIVKRPPGPGDSSTPPYPPAAPQVSSKPKVANSLSRTSSAEPETYIIENGIRKRVKAEVYANTNSITSGGGGDEDKPKMLPNRYKIEPSRTGANRGSLPDVSACRELEKKLMPREEASRLSHQRRAELSLQQQEAERRRQQEIVLRLADLKVGNPRQYWAPDNTGHQTILGHCRES